MNIELTQREQEMLSAFAAKQYEGAKDNISTRTPIHVVERLRKEYVEDDNGDVWMWTDGYEWKTFDSFDEMIEHASKEFGEELPRYEDVEYEDVETDGGSIWIDSEKAYCEAFGVEAYQCTIVEYTEPVAFFFIRDEAVKYKDDYQAHNCTDCRIYTYGLGYSNNGDMPVFRALLMRMGEAINIEKKEQRSGKVETCLRKILFRGKRVDNGKWVEGYLSESTICTISDTYVATVIHKKPKSVYDCESYEVDPDTVGQYIGNSDKNGKKIFEWDIMITRKFNKPTQKYVVKYDEKLASFIGYDLLHDLYFTELDGDSDMFVVIGNIHDNPELLEQKP